MDSRSGLMVLGGVAVGVGLCTLLTRSARANPMPVTTLRHYRAERIEYMQVLARWFLHHT
jgi:hypothetical protein